MAIDIHADDGDGYTAARHILVELDDAGDDGLSAAELAWLIGCESAPRMGAWLRDLRVRGWVYSRPVSPASTRVRWYVSPVGLEQIDAWQRVA